MIQFNCKVMPTNDTEYNCHTKVVELLNHTGSISCHTPLLLLIALRVAIHTHVMDKIYISRNQAQANL